MTFPPPPPLQISTLAAISLICEWILSSSSAPRPETIAITSSRTPEFINMSTWSALPAPPRGSNVPPSRNSRGECLASRVTTERLAGLSLFLLLLFASPGSARQCLAQSVPKEIKGTVPSPSETRTPFSKEPRALEE